MKNAWVKIFLFFLIYAIAGNFVVSQNSWPVMSWDNAENLTPVVSSSGIAELSGLYWNDDLNRLYMVENKGSMRVLQYNQSSGNYSLIANISNLDSPEGITQINNTNQEFI